MGSGTLLAKGTLSLPCSQCIDHLNCKFQIGRIVKRYQVRKDFTSQVWSFQFAILISGISREYIFVGTYVQQLHGGIKAHQASYCMSLARHLLQNQTWKTLTLVINVNRKIHTHTHTHTCINMCVCVCVSIVIASLPFTEQCQPNKFCKSGGKFNFWLGSPSAENANRTFLSNLGAVMVLS